MFAPLVEPDAIASSIEDTIDHMVRDTAGADEHTRLAATAIVEAMIETSSWLWIHSFPSGLPVPFPLSPFACLQHVARVAHWASTGRAGRH